MKKSTVATCYTFKKWTPWASDRFTILDRSGNSKDDIHISFMYLIKSTYLSRFYNFIGQKLHYFFLRDLTLKCRMISKNNKKDRLWPLFTDFNYRLG